MVWSDPLELFCTTTLEEVLAPYLYDDDDDSDDYNDDDNGDGDDDSDYGDDDEKAMASPNCPHVSSPNPSCNEYLSSQCKTTSTSTIHFDHSYSHS